MYCNHCGKYLPDTAKFCTGCGKKVADQQTQGFNNIKNNNDAKDVKKGNKSLDNKKIIPFILAGLILIVGLIAVMASKGGNDNNDKADDYNSDYISGLNDSDDDIYDNDPEPVIEAPEQQQKLIASCYNDNATLLLMEWQDGDWIPMISIEAKIGVNGTSYNKVEGDKCTPAGTFNILYYVAITPVDSKLDFVRINQGDIWVCDPNSQYYNTLQSSNTTPDWNSGLTENMYAKFANQYSTACIVFDYNGDGINTGSVTINKGSDIFIDGIGNNGKLNTGYGDIKIYGDDMLMLLSYLDSSKNPYLVVE